MRSLQAEMVGELARFTGGSLNARSAQPAALDGSPMQRWLGALSTASLLSQGPDGCPDQGASQDYSPTRWETLALGPGPRPPGSTKPGTAQWSICYLQVKLGATGNISMEATGQCGKFPETASNLLLMAGEITVVCLGSRCQEPPLSSLRLLSLQISGMIQSKALSNSPRQLNNTARTVPLTLHNSSGHCTFASQSVEQTNMAQDHLALFPTITV